MSHPNSIWKWFASFVSKKKFCAIRTWIKLDYTDMSTQKIKAISKTFDGFGKNKVITSVIAFTCVIKIETDSNLSCDTHKLNPLWELEEQ